MAGTQKTSQFTAATVANPTDEVPLLQGGVLKRVQVKTLVGNPDVGWLATGESWTYSSWDATRRIGVVNVPSDATTKYTAGNRVRISQTTGGTKYAIITYVTSTTLTLHFPSGITLNNEAISTPFYSPLDSPIGFPTDQTLWVLEWTSTSQINVGSIALAATITNVTGASLQVGKGLWDVSFFAYGQITHAGTTYLNQILGLSTSNNSWSDAQLKSQGTTINLSTAQGDGSQSRSKRILFSSDVTLYLNTQAANPNTTQYVNGKVSTTVIRAISAYL